MKGAEDHREGGGAAQWTRGVFGAAHALERGWRAPASCAPRRILRPDPARPFRGVGARACGPRPNPSEKERDR